MTADPPRSLRPRRFALLRAVLLVAAVVLLGIELASRFVAPRAPARALAAPVPAREPTGYGEVIVPALPEGATVTIDGRPAEAVTEGGARCVRERGGADGGGNTGVAAAAGPGDTMRCLLPAGGLRTVVVHAPGREDDVWTIAVPDPGGHTTLLH